MGDMGDMYRDLEADKKEKCAKYESSNMAIISTWLDGASDEYDTIKVKFMPGIVGFRLPGKPVVDFYPTKNKWRKGAKIYYGDADKFLNWYEKQ